jgi:hypothetical protein
MAVNKQIKHKTMRGRDVDMDLLRKKNELTPAIGNARVNARGDELGPGGKIVRKREEVVREFYDSRAPKVKDAPGTFAEKDAKGTLAEPNEIVEELTEAEKELIEEDAEWVEDEDGNFVPKGE